MCYDDPAHLRGYDRILQRLKGCNGGESSIRSVFQQSQLRNTPEGPKQLSKVSSRCLLGISSRMEACYIGRRITASLSMCYQAVAKIPTMTPKLKLNDDARKTLLSCILKFLLLGM